MKQRGETGLSLSKRKSASPQGEKGPGLRGVGCCSGEILFHTLIPPMFRGAGAAPPGNGAAPSGNMGAVARFAEQTATVLGRSRPGTFLTTVPET